MDSEDLKLPTTHVVDERRETGVCYCVLKLAERGELFTFIEYTDKFPSQMVRSLFRQLIDGNKLIK
jgi:hypothetical protein